MPQTRTIDVPPATIVPATDLGSVEVAKEGNLYLLTDQRGDIRLDGRGLGLYDLDTRILSASILRLNGTQLTLLRGPYRDGGADTIQLTNAELRRNPADKRTAATSLARRELSLTRTRRIDGALREQVMIESYSAMTETIEIELGLGVDMADIFEVRGYPRKARGTLCPIEVHDDRIDFAYDGLDGRRRTTTVGLPRATVEPVDDREGWPGATVIARWRARLRPGRRLTIDWTVTNTAGDEASLVVAPAAVEVSSKVTTTTGTARANRPRQPPAPRFTVPGVDSDHELLDRTVTRSVADLAALRNDGPNPGEHYLAAGVPWFATLFGRDSIIAALETVAFIPSFAVATLEVLARLQAKTDDPWLDAEPGKILHELRTGEMARAGETPHAGYYGSVDSTPLWLILLGEAHAWTGDDALLDRLWPNALAALAWIDDYGDLDGDGFIEYKRRSKLGLLNQGWKDSGDAIRHTDGRPAEGPIALAEVQGYVYAARRAMARLARHRGETELAAKLDSTAEAIRVRFDTAFWLEDAGFYAMALDGEKRQVASIGSNAGQALWTGIVPVDRAARVAERLFEPDMFSGWGIRTFAAGQPGYNPVGYHTGSIWPHDNALIAAGLKANGAADSANLLAGRLIEAAQWFPDLRLPELFCGFSRGDVGAPVAYPVACSPQAWAAAAPFYLLHTMLGLRADASAKRLELIRPTLPDWLGKLTITGLPVGNDSVDLLVHRWRGRTSAELLGRRGSIDVIIHV
ncbi:MAG: glycogen debranching N-terminal domain-containing protein [Chloroflexota bacterium]